MNNIKIRRIAAGSMPFLSGTLAILLAIAIISSPEGSFKASLQGLKLWWTLVFPALLPFLILSEMLTASGFVHGFGVLLEPIMKKIFRLPGASGWTLALGVTAGFPGGASGVMQLHKQGSITDKEAGRLASLAHFSSPVTLLIVIGVAFLHSPTAGYFLLAIHWISGLLAGYTDALLNGKPNNSQPYKKVNPNTKRRPSLLNRVTEAANEARLRDGRNFGQLLGESVASAVQNLMIVGGYIIMFAVIIHIFTSLFPMVPTALPAGLMEIHLGTNALSTWMTSSSGLNTILGMALLSAALGWSGLCAQLQALTMLKQAGVRFLPYAVARLLHGLYAFLLTLLLWKPLLSFREATLPTLAGSETAPSGTVDVITIWSSLPQLISLQSLLLLILLLLSTVIYLFTSIRHRFG